MGKTTAVDTPEVWVIRHKTTGEIFKARSGKSSWKKPAHAKSAWYGSSGDYFFYSKEDIEKYTKPLGVEPVHSDGKNSREWTFPYFDQQSTWELTKLETTTDREIKELRGRIENLKNIIDTHFSEHGVPDCEESLFQCDFYLIGLDMLTCQILQELGYFNDQ